MNTDLELKIHMILESRVCIEDASIIFNISLERLRDLADSSATSLILNRELREAIRYLFNYEATYYNDEDKKKTRWLAKLWLRKYINILKIEDKKEQGESLKDFKDRFIDKKAKLIARENHNNLSREDKDTVLRYQIKYGLSNKDLAEILSLSRDIFTSWAKSSNNEFIKKRYFLLNEYYKTIRESNLSHTRNKYAKMI